MNDFKRVLIGLPKELVDSVLWVSRKYRTNPLSHEPGGCDVVIEYHNGDVFGYDWIKFPSRYVRTIWDKDISEIHDDYQDWDEEDQIEEIKKEIKSIFARKYKKINFKTERYKEIWNSSTNDELPWNLLEKYDYNDKL